MCSYNNCNASFHHQSQLDVHIGIHRNEIQHSCYYCPWRGQNYSRFEEHLKLHFQLFDLQCTKCDYKTTTRIQLNQHIRGVHDDTKYGCLLCKAKLNLPTKLQAHLKKKHNKLDDWRKYLVTIEAKITTKDVKEVFGEHYKPK